MILILHMELHGRLNEHGGSNNVGFVVGVQVVQEVASVLLGRVEGLSCTEEV